MTEKSGRGVRIDMADVGGDFAPFGRAETFTFSGVWDGALDAEMFQPASVNVKLFPKAVHVFGMYLYAGYFEMGEPVTREWLTGSSVVFKGKCVSWVPASRWRRLGWYLLGAPIWHVRAWLGGFIGRDED